jgi:zinc-ribbon domain
MRSKIANQKSKMSRPEISHRCPSCGAAVREADALFCRECGKPLSAKAKNAEPAEPGEVSSSKPVEAEETDASETAEEKASETPQAEPAATLASNEVPVPVPDKEASATEAPATADESAAAHPAARRGDKTRERLHRASEVARGVTRNVIEEPAKRVEKIRHVSTVVIEEASYDPSLRFVLVALGLFVVFVVLLVLSKVMG